MARLGCLLMFVSFAALCVLVVLPVLPFLSESPALDNVLKPILCNTEERIEREQYSSRTRDDGTSYSMNVYCVYQNGQRRDVTDRWQVISLVSFLAPFLLGLFGLIFGLNRAAKNRTITATTATINLMGANPSRIKLENMLAAMPKPTKQSLTERLKQLEEARNAGLISAEEYDRLRKEILDDVV